MNIFSSLKKYKKQIICACILVGLGSFAELMLPNIMTGIIDKGINGNGGIEYIIKQGLLMLAIAVSGMSCYIGAARMGAVAVTGFSNDLKFKIFKKVDEMNFDQFSVLGPSALLTRTIEDVYLLNDAIYFIMRIVIALPVMFIGGIIMAFSKDAMLSLILFAFLPIIVVVVIIIGKKMIKLYDISDEYIDKQNQLMRERLTGIRVIRAFNREETEHQKITDATNIMADKMIKANIRGGLINPIAQLLLNIATVLIILIGGKRITPQGALSAADIIAVIQYISIIMGAIMMFAWAILFLPHVKVKVNRINQVLKVDTTQKNERTFETFKGDIKTEHLGFKYKGSEGNALSDININIPDGSVAAFIGGTGSGKSTVLSLLMGFYAPTEGSITIDNHDYSNLNEATIRDNISCALQKSTVFSATVKENILMGKENATDEEINEAVDIAEMSDFIKSKSDGIEFKIEEGGANLSGGQKQRIAIARAIIKPAAIYAFDDSFSALDFLTESKLRKKLNEHIKGKTQLIITQRISTAMSADIIYVFDKGRIVGSGKHKDLLDSCEIYREIYRSQTGGDING